MRRTLFTAEHDAFRKLCHDFLSKEATPRAQRWESQGIVDRDIWTCLLYTSDAADE